MYLTMLSLHCVYRAEFTCHVRKIYKQWAKLFHTSGLAPLYAQIYDKRNVTQKWKLVFRRTETMWGNVNILVICHNISKHLFPRVVKPQSVWGHQWTFFLAYFNLSPLLKNVRKVVCGFGRKVVLEQMWKSQETHVRHWPLWYELSPVSC